MRLEGECQSMKITHITQGTCSRTIDIALDGEIIREVRFAGGCSGNTRGVAALVQDMPATEVVRRLRGIVCRGGTSCPDQLAQALEEAILKKAV
jgi:uncharacterized protein (TIGR03905 family)